MLVMIYELHSTHVQPTWKPILISFSLLTSKASFLACEYLDTMVTRLAIVIRRYLTRLSFSPVLVDFVISTCL